MTENYDYWKTNSIEQHEQFLRDLIKQGLSNGEMLKRISARFGEDTIEFEQQKQLEAKINSMISPKMRERLSLEQYCALREKILQKILGSAEEDAKKVKEEEARVTGEFCLNCGSTEVKSYDNFKWFCKSCRKYFSKR